MVCELGENQALSAALEVFPHLGCDNACVMAFDTFEADDCVIRHIIWLDEWAIYTELAAWQLPYRTIPIAANG